MQNIINLNSSIPEIFLSISILGQLLFGAYLAYNKHYKYSAVLKEISVHTNITVFFFSNNISFRRSKHSKLHRIV